MVWTRLWTRLWGPANANNLLETSPIACEEFADEDGIYYIDTEVRAPCFTRWKQVASPDLRLEQDAQVEEEFMQQNIDLTASLDQLSRKCVNLSRQVENQLSMSATSLGGLSCQSDLVESLETDGVSSVHDLSNEFDDTGAVHCQADVTMTGYTSCLRKFSRENSSMRKAQIHTIRDGIKPRLETPKSRGRVSNQMETFAADASHTTPRKVLHRDGASRVCRAKMCVCSASSTLGRERSRLLRADTVLKRSLGQIVDREREFNAFDDSVSAREEVLNERQERLQCKERELECNPTGDSEADLLEGHAVELSWQREILSERESSITQTRRDLQRREHRLQTRRERAETMKRQLENEDARGVLALTETVATEANVAAIAREALATSEAALQEKRSTLARLNSELYAEWGDIRARRDELEPIQNALQAKDADLCERIALLERRKDALAKREAGLERLRSETRVGQEKLEHLRKQAEETEQRLGWLWDDTHQRQQLLDDVSTCLQSRERQIQAQQLTLAHMLDGATMPDVEQLQLDVAVAALAECSWQEQSVNLAAREAELRAHVQLLQLEATS